MGFNKPTWFPGRERVPVPAPRSRQLAEVRERRERHTRDRLAARQLEGSLMSLAALLGSDVKDPTGATVGHLRDVTVNWTIGAPFPRMTGVVLRAGRRDVLIGARWVEISAPATVRLSSSKAYVRAYERHPADIALAHDVLDHQVTDSSGTQLLRPADVYLVAVDGRIEAGGIEVGVRALLRRLGPKRLRARVRPQRVIDWRDIASFAPARDDGDRRGGRRADLAGEAGTGLELGAAGADVKRFRPSEVRDALRAYKTEQGGDEE